MTMPDGTPPSRPVLTDHNLRRAVVALGPLAEQDSVAGLRARYRDPREHPGTGGEQRDAAAALDDASDRGTLGAARDAYRRLGALTPQLQATGRWLASWGGAVRKGAIVNVETFVAHYAEHEAPLVLRERASAARDAHTFASIAFAFAKKKAAKRLTPESAKKIDAARTSAANAAARHRAAAEMLDAWARGRLTLFLFAWDAAEGEARDGE